MVKAKNYLGLLLALMLPVVLTARTQQPPDQHHNHQQDKKRVDGVNERGDHAMGFSHEKTAHHFHLTADGGAIEVTANDPDDAASEEQIRTHLSHIARLFKEGDFNTPMLIHGEAPPGVPTMKRLKAAISYRFETIGRGARVRIDTANAEAVKAIHEFLRYQIKDHQTGDSLEADKQAARIPPTAVVGSFRHSLQTRALDCFLESHPRQWVDRSSPAYRRGRLIAS